MTHKEAMKQVQKELFDESIKIRNEAFKSPDYEGFYSKYREFNRFRKNLGIIDRFVKKVLTKIDNCDTL